MRRRTLIGTIGVLGLAALIGLFAAFSFIFSPQDAVFAQSNNPPSFASEETTRAVDENTPWLQAIGIPVRATDDDEDDPLTYSLENAATSHFTIVRSTGQLQTGAPLDYEDQSVYTVKVIATDPSGAKDSITVTIHVNDVEEPGTVSLSWKQPQVGTELEATLTDPDGQISGLAWQWAKSGSRSGTYTDIATATLSSYTPVDADKSEYLRATASYADNHGSGKGAEAVSYRSVREEPADNNAPVFREADGSSGYACPEDIVTDYCLSVSRSTPVGDEIYNPARAADPDQYDEVRYSLVGADTGSFGVVASSGYLFTKVPMNTAGAGPYTVTLKASDESGAADTATFTIRLSGGRMNPVVIGPERISYPEGGTWRVATYTATVQDRPTRGWLISVQHGGGEGDFFDIDDDGVLTFREPPDYKDPGDNQYSFGIMAYDGNPPQGQRPGQTFFNVRVTVIDVEEANEQPAFADATAARSSIENTAAGENVGDPVSATDPDRDALEYTLGGADSSSFDIDSSTGQLLTNAALDHETKPSYSVTVSVRDSKDADGNPDTATDDTIDVTITVTDVNEAPEFPSTETGTRNVAENTASGENVSDPVAATDPDVDSLHYTLGGTDASSFGIDSSTGQLLTDATLDHETTPSYSVTVSVRDSKDADGNPDSATDDTIDVTITVTNVDEDGTVTLVLPPPRVGTELTATLSDPDGTVSDATWVWEGSADGSTGWTVVTGAVSTVTTSSYTPVDGDLGRYLRATATYTDPEGSGKSAEAVSGNPVQARPVTNSAPEFPAPTTTRAVDEDTVGGGNVGAPVTATDTDTGDTLTYKLEGADAAVFEIDSTSGQIKVATGATLDYETKQSHEVTVSVRDSKDDYGASNTATDDSITVTITVTNVDEDGTVTLAPPQPQVGTPQTAALTDPDGTVSGTTWVWESSADGSTGWTVVSGATSTLTTSSYTPVTADVGRYLRATATYTDPEGSGKSAEAVSANPVRVRPVTNSAPQFSAETATRGVDEDAADGENVGAPVTATDTNTGDTLTYTLEGADPAVFAIDSTSGQIKVATGAKLDYESKNSHEVTVSVRDSRDDYGVSDTSTDDSITVTITVNDVNETPDVMGPDSIDYDENGDGEVARYSAFDPETGNITWSWDGDDKDRFEPDANGVLNFKTPPDHETPTDKDGDNVYQVTVEASDGTNTGFLPVTVTVTNVDEDGTVTLSSDQPQTGTALTATLSDPDGAVSGTTWVWESSADGSTGWTVVTGATSTVTTSSYTPVDDDLGRYLRVTATYTDPEDSGKSAEAMAANRTNAAPVFSSNTADRSVVENAAMGDNIGTPVTATDADTLEYTLGGTDMPSFGIVTASGQLQTKAALDYEDRSSYEVTVTAADPAGATATIPVTITVTNEEEAGTVTLSSVQPQVGTALTATLEDPDGVPSTVTWQWARSSTSAGGFTNVSSGGTSASYTPVTGDVNQYLRATATYTDPQGSGKSASGVSVNPVEAESATNNPPAFSSDTATRSVPENTASGVDFGTAVTASDADSDDLTYSLGGTDAASFGIVAASGQLQTKVELDYEVKNSYEVTVTATDPSDAADSIIVTIDVENVDEDGRVTLLSLQPQVGAELTAELSDLDGEPTRVAWQWARGDTSSGPFTNVSSGENPAGYTPVADDVGKFLRATATYTDPQGSGKSASKVSENAVREAPATNAAPFFSSATATRSVAENAVIGANIGTPVTAADAVSDTLTYSLGGTDAASFDIVPGTGQLQTGIELNYEAKISYEVTVTATDPSTESDSITVTVTVINQDEAGAVQLSTVQPQVGTELTGILTDPDGAVSGVTWQWARSNNDDTYSNISSAAAYEPVAADVGKYLRATATYTDPQGGSKTASGVSVNPVQAAPAGANAAPVFSSETASRSVSENAEPGSNIGTPVVATDADTLTYTLGGTDAASFDIVTTSGQLQTKADLDYEGTSSYEVTVTATDPSGEADSVTVTVTVNNLDEEGTVTLSSDQPEVGTALTATLEDPDGTVSSVTWQWARGDTTGILTDIASGNSYTPGTADLGKYLRATASYTDPEGSSKKAMKVSANRVQAAPVANNQLGFSGSTATRLVEENTPTGQNIGDPVTAIDLDSVDTLTYSLGGVDGDSFGIDTTSGQLLTKDPLDYEDDQSYTVTVSVHDGKDSNGASDTAVDATITITINLENVEEPGAVTLSSAQPLTGTAFVAGLTDPDGSVSNLTWQWASSATSRGTFDDITGATSASYTPVAGDLGNYLQATATYSDGHGGNKSAVTVSSKPTNSAPVFSEAAATRSVAEDASVGANVGAPVTATDADTLSYTLGGTDAASFSIVETSGQLQTGALLDYEVRRSYEVTVTATDTSDVSASIVVTITVTNVEEPGTVTLSTIQPQVGTEVTAQLTDPDGDPTRVIWQWARATTQSGSWTNISSGVDRGSYTPVAADVNMYLRAWASYSDPHGGSKTANGVSDNPVQAEPAVSNSAPSFSENTAERSVSENTAGGTDFGTPVTASDANSDTLTYTLGGADADSFGIVAASGQLQTKGPLDYESRSSYQVTVTAADPSNASDVIPLTITVSNVDEHGAVKLSSVQPQVGTPLTATLTDPDGVTSSVAWQWAKSATASGTFTNVSSGPDPATYTPVDADLDMYLRATATYTDPEGSGKTARVVSYSPVRAAPAINSAPAFSEETATRPVAENAEIGANVGTPVTASDAENDALTYVVDAGAAPFEIVQTTGQLQTTAALDFEETASYSVTVTATDPSNKSDTITVTITVDNLDEDGAVTLSSLQPQVGEPLTASLEDPDGATSTITWQWASGDSNVAGGATYTPVATDVGKYLQATATYTDPQGPGKTAYGVSANAVQAASSTNSAPEFGATTAVRTVPENTAAGRSIGSPVTATDSDNDTLTYSLGGTDAGSFGIVPATGQLQTKATLDSEVKQTYTVVVTATDSSGEYDTITVTINVINVDEAPTVSGPTSRNYKENDIVAVGSYAATNPENGTIVWRKSGDDSDDFSVSSAGELTFISPPDFEFPGDTGADNVYHVTVEAFDGTDTGSLTVTVTVTNEDDPGQLSLPSDQPQVDSEMTALLADQDGTVSNETWKWESSSDGQTNWATISGATSANYTPVAADVGKNLRVTVTYTDPQGPGKTSNAVAAGVVLAAPNSVPQFSGGPVTRSVDENTPPGKNIGAPITATDTTGDTLTYKLGGDDGDSFSIVSRSGQLQTKDPLDYESKSSSSVTVIVTDSASAAADVPVTINVTNVNEAPEFPAPTATRVVPENTATATDFGHPVTASDPDTGDTLAYSLGGTDAASFEIVEETGQLQTKNALDFETKNSYTVTVTATDASGASDEVTVAITVTNVVELPVVTGSTSVDYAENGLGVVATYTATNPDNGTITWDLSGVDRGDLLISRSGVLTFRNSPDHEAPADANTDNEYQVTVEVTDGTSTDTLAMTVTVTNVDEPGTISLSSVQPQVDTALTATLTDPDVVAGAPGWQWAKADSATGAFGNISGATSASYTPITGDLGKYLQVTASYTDGEGSGKSAESAPASPVRVRPANNAAPSFPATDNGARSVAENTAAGQNIGAPVSATDPNTNDALTYSLGGTHAGFFDIVATSGQLQTKVALNYESKSSYSVTVTVTDPSGLTDAITVVIRVTDVNEAPEFPTETGARSVAENTVAGQSIGAPVAATDPDNGDTLTYSLSGTDAASFDIVGTSGQLQTKAPLDYETKSSYTVTVSVQDSEDASGAADEATDDTIDVTIAVTGVNEAPVFPGATTTRSIAENTASGRNIGIPVAATDPDRGSALTYFLSGTDSGSFTIVPRSGQLRTNAGLDHETKSSYSVIVSVRDGKNASGVADTATDDTIAVTINVTDRNEPPGKPAIPMVGPASTNGHTTLSVSWNAPPNRGPAIWAYDVEYRKNGTGSWLDDSVVVSGTTATISGVTPDSNYQARVMAKNAEGDGPWSAPGNGRTGVTPLNLQATLTVNYQSASYSVTEGGSRSITVTLSEPADRALSIPITTSNGTAEYGDYQVTGLNNNALSISPGDSNRSFTFRALHEADRSNETVNLGFGSLPSKVTAGARNTATVSITDDDVLVRTSNDDDDDYDDDDQDEKSEIDPLSNIVDSDTSGNRAPVFVEGVSTKRTVPEHAEPATYIGSPVIATDPDGDVLTYSLGDVFDGRTFVVDSAWGQLMTKGPLDFETRSSYTVVVGVTDGRGAGDTMVVTINLTDMQEVLIGNPQTQAVGKVEPDAEATIETPDGVGAVAFPAGSRESSYQVRVDSASSNCGSDIPEGALRASLSVEYFDNWGRQEHDVVLDQPATIMLRLDASELGGVNQVLAAHRRGGFNVFARSDGAGEWSDVDFTLEANDQGTITLTVGGLYRLHCFAAATDAAAFGSVVQPAVETPTPTPTPRPTVQPAPEPTPAPTPTPTPVAAQLPTATPTIVSDVTETPEPKPPVVSLVEEVSAAAEPEAPDGPATPVREESVDTPIWPILMMIAGVTMIATGGGLYLLARRRRRAEGRP